jgi:hypothetical protein
LGEEVFKIYASIEEATLIKISDNWEATILTVAPVAAFI